MSEKYLGDEITASGSHTKCIKARTSKCIGVMADISNMLKMLCLGQYMFRVAIILRQAMFLSVMLLNTSTWLRLSQSDIKLMETSDEIQMRNFLSAPRSTPIVSIYLTFGAVPIRFQIKSRRVMFLHYLLRRDKSEMISRVLYAQIKNPVKGDWYLVVKEDLDSLGLGHLTLEDMASKSKYTMKKLVREAMEKSAFQYLMEKKQGMSKLKDLKYDKLKFQSYLACSQMNNREKRLAFSLQTRMVNLSSNYGLKINCKVCKGPNTEDNQLHLFQQCTTLKQLCPELQNNDSKYEDLFSNDVVKISKIVKLFDVALRKRAEILEKEK